MVSINYPRREIEVIEKVGTKVLSKTSNPSFDRIKESMDFTQKHNSILERVKNIMRYDKYARKNYLWLLVLYYAKCNMIKILVPLEDFERANSPESIERCRREIYSMAKKGDKELKWLLDGKEFLEESIHTEELVKDYYREKINEERARVIK